MAAIDTLRIAASKIGYRAANDPQPGSEAGRWMAATTGQPWLAGPSTSIWWCMCFVSMCVYQGGGRMPGGPQFNTDAAVSAARRESRLVDKADIQPGDVLIYDWKWGTATTDHTGLAELRPNGATVQAIEGNTSPGTAGSQSAGNGVWRRVRPLSAIRYVIRPYYDGAPTSSTPEEDIMASKEEVVAALLDAPIARQGGPTGTTNLRQTVAWLDASLGKIINAQAAMPAAIINGLLDAPITRGGRGAEIGKTTTLRAVLGWSDNTAISIIEAAGKASEASGADPEKIKQAVVDAISSIQVKVEAN